MKPVSIKWPFQLHYRTTQNMISPLSDEPGERLPEAPEKSSKSATFVLVLSKLQVFKKYGAIFWSFVLLCAVYYSCFLVLTRFFQNGEIVFALESVDSVSYSLSIILTPVSLYQLSKYVPHLKNNCQDMKAPSYMCIIIMTFASTIVVVILFLVSVDAAEELFSNLMFRFAESLTTGVKMLVFGIVTSSFKIKCDNLCKKIGNKSNSLQQYRLLLVEFKLMKKGFQFWLFVEFTCCTISLILWAYLSLLTIFGCYVNGMAESFSDILSLILNLVFYALTTHDCYSSFGELTTSLR